MAKVITLTEDLVRCASVTPADAGAQGILIAVLEELGFTCTRLKFGAIENFFARRGTGGQHLCFAGHTDVVPPGDEGKWTHPPFGAITKDGLLYGRGTADMKGNIAAFVAAVSQYSGPGSISVLITGDEEGPAIDGTVKVLEWMKQNNQIPDACIVGEPTNPNALGDEIKIGRRGSLSGRIIVHGVQGHVAYPERADNPIPRLARMIDSLSAAELDQGSDHFGSSTLQFSTLHVGNTADNVIPGAASANFNIRFNDHWTHAALEAEIRATLDLVDDHYTIEFTRGAQSFLTAPGNFTSLVRDAVQSITGRTPKLSTSGGTSDARFVHHYCPVVECGLINKTIHQIDEHIAIDDLKMLEKIYLKIIQDFCGA